MGCGAICGDTLSANSTATAKSINTMHQILPLLHKNSALVSQNIIGSFLKSYHFDAKKYHFKVK